MATTLFARDLVRSYRKNAPDITPRPLSPDLAVIYRPGVQLLNLAFENTRHRTMHIETQHAGMMQSVHSTLCPRPQYDAPILTMDLVTVGETVTYALVDACPLTSNLSLPSEYDAAFHDIQAQYGLAATPRQKLPDFGRSIFSRRCFLRTTGIDQTLFARFALDCVAMHIQYCDALDVSKNHGNNRSAHQRVSRQQRMNEKRRSLLLNALNGDRVLTDAYLQMVFE